MIKLWWHWCTGWKEYFVVTRYGQADVPRKVNTRGGPVVCPAGANFPQDVCLTVSCNHKVFLLYRKCFTHVFIVLCFVFMISLIYTRIISRSKWIIFPYHSWANSSPPSVAYMHRWTGSALVQVMVCHLRVQAITWINADLLSIGS